MKSSMIYMYNKWFWYVNKWRVLWYTCTTSDSGMQTNEEFYDIHVQQVILVCKEMKGSMIYQ
jgi:hypothetical protein